MKTKNLLGFIAALASGLCVSAPYPQYQNLVDKHAAAQGLDPNLVWAVMARESDGNRYARSHKNAQGLLQVIPATAARMGVNPKHLYNPEHNIIAGTRYLAFLSKRFNGNLDYILAGYNAGEGAVDKYKGIPPYRETQNYVRFVRSRYAQLSGNPAYAAKSGLVKVSTSRSNNKNPQAVAQAVALKASTNAPPPKQYAAWDVFQEF